MASTDPASAPPRAFNALAGAVGIGVRLAAATVIAADAAVRTVTAPGRAAVRAGLSTPPGKLAHSEMAALYENLDAVGRRDIARVRAELDHAIDRLVTDSVTSERASIAIDRVLESPELWELVDRVANSPEVLDAIASASVGLTNVVADEARRRTVTADEFAERFARRILRRSPRPPAHPAPPTPPAIEPASGKAGTPGP